MGFSKDGTGEWEKVEDKIDEEIFWNIFQDGISKFSFEALVTFYCFL